MNDPGPVPTGSRHPGGLPPGARRARRRTETYAARMLATPLPPRRVAEDAFLALYRSTCTRFARPRLPAWLYRSPATSASDQLRRRKFKLSLFRDLGRVTTTTPFTPRDECAAPADQIAQARESECRHRARHPGVPAKFRDGLPVCEVEGMSYEDAAAVPVCPVRQFPRDCSAPASAQVARPAV